MNLDVVLPHIPKRRDGESKAARTVEDIFTVLVFLDKHLQICKLPKYVADSPDAMPSVRLYAGDLASLMKILTKLENEVKDLHTEMAAITKGLEHRPASQSFTGSVINRHTDIDGPARVQPGSAGAGKYRLMLLGRATPVVNARLPLTEACVHGLRGLWPRPRTVTDNTASV